MKSLIKIIDRISCFVHKCGKKRDEALKGAETIKNMRPASMAARLKVSTV